jgi:DNA-binding SARP family transcriptional activator
MNRLELRFLGDLEVVRGGQSLPLPPSRKTRALLAYLALNERSFRREHLCELLWEVPDDPRGSLRWSLSKLSRLVDDEDCQRIVADRSHVRFNTDGVEIDVLSLRSLVGGKLSELSTDALEQAAKQFGGRFLEGLELSNFHEFHAWCIAEREQSIQAQIDLLTEIVERKRDEPEAALPYARSLVTNSPYSETARESLIRLLVTAGRSQEAKQQYALGARMLKEIGAQPTGALSRALESAHGTGAATPMGPLRRTASEPAAANLRAGEAASLVVGRRAELLQLAGMLEAAIEKRESKFLLLRGEPGIGKTRLLEATRELAGRADAWVAEASAFESESIRPFAIWVDALRKAAPETASEIFGAREGENRERLLAGLSDFVSSMAARKLVVLLFDDLQWCDDSSATALHYVARTNRHLPIVAVLAAREGEFQDNAAFQHALNGLRHARLLTEISLAPLSEEAIRELVAARAPDVSSDRLSRQCGGNPLFAIELARAELSGDSGDSLSELVRERLARLDVESGEVLRWAAVLAPRIDIGMLERVAETSLTDIGTALELGERQGMLQATESGYRFSHELVARSIYADISPARCRMMHRRIAEILEQETAVELEHAADLAHHAAQSGDIGLAVRAMVSAGRLCLRFYANDEALSLAQRGLSLVEKLPAGERVRLTIDLKDVLLTAAPLEDWEAAVDEYIALAEQALDHGALSHARRGYHMASYVRWMHGHWSGAREETLQAERVSRGGSDEEHIVGMAEAAYCLALLERDLAQADAMLMEAQALAARKGVAHHSIPSALGMLRYHENRFDAAKEFFNQARTLAKSAGDRISEYQINEYLVMIDIETGDYEAAKIRCETLLDIGSRLRAGSEAPFARVLEAVCDYALGEEPDSLSDALEELREADAKHRLAYALTRAALLDFDRGRFEKAIERAGEALENAKVLDRATDMLMAHIVLARAYRSLDDRAAFEKHARFAADMEPGRVAEWARLKAKEELA